MAKNKEKKCARCGKVVQSYSYGDYCHSCAADVWDAGFESTTQHAEEIYEQQMKDMDEINEHLNKAKISVKNIKNLIEYESGTLGCSKCGKLRLRLVRFPEPENDDELRNTLTTPCPKCGTIGYLKFGPK
jgi:Zn finger protein HypA/HybF involved in hydrogenase expression